MSEPTRSTAAQVEEHDLPCLEALLAGTLALMTGYSQALLAEVHPEQRLRMGAKIGHQLAVLAEQPVLSPGFQAVMSGLQHRWQAMSECTAAAQRDCQAVALGGAHLFSAPSRLQ